MAIWNPDKYIKAWNFASQAHQGQHVPGSELPYINHIGNVAMEIMGAVVYGYANTLGRTIENPDLAVQCALLHDVIEDTAVTYDQIEAEFGGEVAAGVLALSKNPLLPHKNEQMADSLARIKTQPAAVWLVKLADRITNLKPPPKHWDREKIKNYRAEAELILAELGAVNQYLTDRLKEKIAHYERYL